MLLGLTFGYATGVTALAFGMLLKWFLDWRNQRRFASWVRDPESSALNDASGEWANLYAMLSRRSRAAAQERELLASQVERFREAGQAMPDGVLYLAEGDRIDWVNRVAEQHFGLDTVRDDGIPVTTLLRQPEFVRYLQSGNYTEPLTLRSGRRQGLVLLLQVVSFGDARKMIVSRDISHLEKLETMRQDFIANVSHELRTPLTVVMGFVETVLDAMDELERDELRHYLELAYDQSQRMRSLIEDLLTLSALETGAPAPAEERVEVGPMLHEIVDDALALSGGRHKVSLELSATDAGDVLLGSRKELRSAFGNLVSNAVRYTPEGGVIRVRWVHGESGAEFMVEDNGIGIDAKYIPRLTERFYRVDRGRSREVGGTGLGLAIVKHVASRHQAELRIESEPGRGSRFSVWMPPSRLVSSHPEARS